MVEFTNHWKNKSLPIGLPPQQALPIDLPPQQQLPIGFPAKDIPSVLLQAVVTFGDKTTEGSLIVAVSPAWFEIIRLLNEDLSAVLQIPPHKWEEIIAGSYERAGFEVTLTPKSGDYGRDIIAVRPGFWSVRIIEQVKRYKPSHLVTAEEVRALSGVLQADHNASKGVLSTTSDFAPRIGEDPFIEPYLPHRLELLNGKALFERLRQVANDNPT